MPALSVPKSPSQDVPPDAFRVLVTGFGPFLHYEENPSWLAVKPLHNVILHTEVPGEAFSSSSSLASLSVGAAHSDPSLIAHSRPIHITTLQIPVIYESVLAIVPGLHARPPRLPSSVPPGTASPPEGNFDFIFHLGVAGRGPLRMERQGHKLGYHMKDATGKLAPVVRVSTKDFSRRGPGDGGVDGSGGSGSASLSAENIERERLGMDMVDTGVDLIARPTRGFGVGYESLPEEITTEIDVTRLVQDLKRSGVEQIYTSMDAGHYLCDFIYYCSLAEVRRSSKPYELKRRSTQVLFLHCPPVGQPLATEEVTDAIRQIVVWVCSEQQLHHAKDDVEASGSASG